MERPPNLHRVSTPLDVHSAQARAAQLDALTDALTLRVLSSLAMDAEAGETTAGVAAALSISSDEAERRVAVLLDCELAITSPTNPKAFQPSSDAWTRYRRLFAPGTARPAVTKTPVVDWDGYPRVIRRMADQLARRYRTTFSTETTERYVAETYDELKGSSTGHQHVPMLVNRLVADRLAEVATMHMFPLVEVPEVLFVCVGNSGRSQIAYAALVAMAGDRVNVRSAGTRPSPTVDAMVTSALAEVGLVPGGAPKELQDSMVEMADYIVTLGCGDACPILPGRRYLDWDVTDPVGLTIDGVRRVRDHVLELVTGLVAEIDSARSHGLG